MMLGLLLARAGVQVTVMEKHSDFLRDFRGDTVHASTLRLLDELGLGDRFAQLPHREIDSLGMKVQGTQVNIDLTPAARAAQAHRVGAAVGLPRAVGAMPRRPSRPSDCCAARRSSRRFANGDKVIGVTYRNPTGETGTLRADLTVACDGRSSTLRAAAGLKTRSFGAPMDVWWFRLPRKPEDPHGLAGVLGAGHACVCIDRGDYYQVAFVIPKGRDAALRARGIEDFHRGVVSLVPWLAGRVEALTSFDDIKLLDVQLNRLRRWYVDGMLLLGDAAHAMSPVGGVGINLAVADAVAAARILAAPLRTGNVAPRRLAQVQARRWVPTALVQAAQRIIHAKVIAVAVSADRALKPPLAVRLVTRIPALRRVLGYAIAIGPLPEHAPSYARR